MHSEDLWVNRKLGYPVVSDWSLAPTLSLFFFSLSLSLVKCQVAVVYALLLYCWLYCSKALFRQQFTVHVGALLLTSLSLSLSPALAGMVFSATTWEGGTSEFEWVCPDFFGKPRRETAISENGPTKSHTRECQRFKTLQKSWLFRLEAIASSKTARIPTSLRPTGQQGQKQSPGHLKISKNRDPKFCSKARGLSSPLKKG